MSFEPAKFKALVHYIVSASPNAIIGKTKLNKTLWFAEREMFLRNGEPISGEAYIKKRYGPVSKHLLEIERMLKEEGKIAVRKSWCDGFTFIEYVSLQKPDLSMFSADEIDTVREQIQRLAPYSAVEVSRMSHDRAWEIADDDEEIPIATVLLGEPLPPTQSDIEWAMQYA